MWILAGIYCGLLWLIFDKLRLIRLSLPIAVLAAAIGPGLILALLFCSQYYHPMSQSLNIFQKVIPIVPQTQQRSRVTSVVVNPNTPVKKGDVLFEVDRVPFQITVDRLKASLNEAEQSIQVALASIDVAKVTIVRTDSDLNYATRDRDRVEPLVKSNAISQEDFDKAMNRYEQARAANDQAHTNLKQSELSVEVARARLAQSKSNLADAEYDLDQATTRAPADGFVTNMQLLPGMLVGGMGATSVMSFVVDRNEEEQGVVVASIPQKNFLLVKPGQYVEVRGCLYRKRSHCWNPRDGHHANAKLDTIRVVSYGLTVDGITNVARQTQKRSNSLKPCFGRKLKCTKFYRQPDCCNCSFLHNQC